MLNELHDLWQAGERAGIAFPLRIPGLDEGQNDDRLRVYVREDGSISRIEAVPAEQMKRIRKWKCGEGITLPVFNFEPLHTIRLRGKQPLLKRLNALSKKARLRLLRQQRPIRWAPGSQSRFQKLAGAFKNVSADLLGKIGEDSDPNGAAWRALLETLPTLDAAAFLRSLSAALRDRLGGPGADDGSVNLLFHNSSKNKPTTVPVQIEPEGEFSARIYSPAAQGWLVSILSQTLLVDADLNSDDQSASVAPSPLTASVDGSSQTAVWGKPRGAWEKYHDVKLPVLGKASLFNRDVGAKPTSARYDENHAIFPIGQDVRMKLMAAVEWLAAEERRGKTWAVRGKPKKEGVFLLLTYLAEKMDDTPEHLAEVFVGPQEEESDRAIVQFETVCAGVVAALDGIPGLSDAARIRVFALHKPDGYRAQVFASESLSPRALKLLASAWQTDCRSHPRILVPQFTQDGEETKVRDLEPLIPFPYQAIECLNTIWEKCGTADNAKSESASDYDFADAFELLRRTGSHPTDAAYLGRMLDLAIRRALPLMTAVGQAMHQVHQRVFLAQGDKARHATKSRLQACRWPCLLSLLLTRLGYQRETSMKEPAFLIGRFLAQLDRLHAYYAKYVSGKEDGLRQLLGNSLMSTALESPLRAFELAGQRMLPYQAWAEQFSRGKDAYQDESKRTEAGFVSSILWDLGRIAEELSQCGIPEANRASLPPRVGHEAKAPTKPILDLADTLKANDRAWMHADSAAKAQMLLGYLARPARKETTTTAATSTPNVETPPDF